MGNDCLASTPNQYYSSYLQKVQVSELKDLWQTIKLYKIKKLYDTYAVEHPQYKKHTHIPFQNFLNMFPEFERYEQKHKRRIFQIFDYDNQGYIDWNNFYSTISICYFAPDSILSVLMFMIFDQSLAKQLNYDQISDLVNYNQFCIKVNTVESQRQAQFQPQQILSQLCPIKAKCISIKEWVQKGQTYFDFSKYRRFFNIFKEEKLQKQLISNFTQWNNLYDEQAQKYVSYVVSFKWFQGWKIYVQQNYGVVINNTATNSKSTKKTMKSFKTKQNMAKTSSKKIRSCKKIGSMKALNEIQVQYKVNKNDEQDKNRIKNIDFIHSNIGERPKQIYNNVLEGQFEQILKPELVQNQDYILVSAKVWSSLKIIYDGFPQFRRTGFDSIQLYPKIIKIYSSLFRSQIDYSSETIRQVSGYLSVQQLLIRSVEMSQQELKTKKVYFKTIGMVKWEQVEDLSYLFAQLSSDTLIFLVYINIEQEQTFKKVHGKMIRDISQINVGDYVKFNDETSKQQKKAVFIGKNIQGKYIFHFPKQSYIYNKCLLQTETLKYCKLITAQHAFDELKLKNTTFQQKLKGIPNYKGLGFINSMIMSLLNNRSFKKLISFIKPSSETPQDHQPMFLQFISQINVLLNNRRRVDVRQIIDQIDIFLPNYQNFQISMCENFANDFFGLLSQQLSQMKIQNVIQSDYKVSVQKKMKCLKCKHQTTEEDSKFLISIPLPTQKQLFFQIIFVPICTSLKVNQIKRYGIRVPINATLKQFKQQFQKAVQLNNNRAYILAQVYGDKIIKNYNSALNQSTLQKLKLRQGDVIYAFQLYVNFQKFVHNHYSFQKQLSLRQARVDQFIDCYHSQKGWIYGKVSEVEILPYTQHTILRVIHKFTKNQQWEVSYDFSQQSVAKFPKNCYKNAQQFHLQGRQRYFNQASNQMQICNIPLVFVLANWMRIRQFSYLIYLQMKRFISQEHQFKNQQDQDDQLETIRLNSNKEIRSTKKITNSVKPAKFKEYLNSESFPYKIHFTDGDGRCAICFKFLKSVVFKGESQSYCEGCTLSQADPITWQLKVSDLIVCIDWKKIDCTKKDIIKDHSSHLNTQNLKKKSVQTIQNCLLTKFQKCTQELQLLCCNRPEQVQIIQRITNKPSILPIFLQRVVEQLDGYKKTITKHINFPVKNLQIGKCQYNLIGLISIQGNNKNIKYKTYVGKDAATEQWYEYDGEHVKVVKKAVIQKCCALMLFYKRKG